MKRVFLFLATNIAIMAVLSITLRLIGFEGILDRQGVDLNINSLVIFAGIFGMGGAFISLAKPINNTTAYTRSVTYKPALEWSWGLPCQPLIQTVWRHRPSIAVWESQ